MSNIDLRKSVEEIEAEIRRNTRGLHEDFNDKEKAEFWKGNIAALEWVLSR